MHEPILGSTSRFALITDALCRAVAARIAGGLMQAAMILLIWPRVRRVESLLLALVERVRAGRGPHSRVREQRVLGVVAGGLEDLGAADRVARGWGAVGAGAEWRGLPRRFGWLMALMPYVAAGYGSQLRANLAEPEMVALLRDVLQAARILGPLCWMLGVELEGVRPSSREGVTGCGHSPCKTVPARVRVVREKVDWGRIPLPRGVLAVARRQGVRVERGRR